MMGSDGAWRTASRTLKVPRALMSKSDLGSVTDVDVPVDPELDQHLVAVEIDAGDLPGGISGDLHGSAGEQPTGITELSGVVRALVEAG